MSFIHSQKQGETTLVESSVGGRWGNCWWLKNGGGRNRACETVGGQRGEEVNNLKIGRAGR